jgi:hypothetical protein
MPPIEVSRLHVIFDLNGVLKTKRAIGSYMQMPTNSSLKLGLEFKDLLTSCLA